MILDEFTFGGPYRIAQLRYALEDGTYHRECRAPGADVSDLPKEYQARITEAWTREIVAAYQEYTAPVPVEEDPTPTPPDPLQVILSKLDAMEARVVSLESSAREEKINGTRIESRGE